MRMTTSGFVFGITVTVYWNRTLKLRNFGCAYEYECARYRSFQWLNMSRAVCVELRWIVAATNGNANVRIIINHKNLVSLNEFNRDENTARVEHLDKRPFIQPTSHSLPDADRVVMEGSWNWSINIMELGKQHIHIESSHLSANETKVQYFKSACSYLHHPHSHHHVYFSN